MRSLFDILKDASKGATKESTRYWENMNSSFGKNIGPDGTVYDEEELYESIKKSDRDRLIKLG